MDNPKISGFTFIKNGISLGYPFIESIKSLDNLCDEIIINVGFDNKELKDDDGTEELILKNFSSKKYKIIKSFWDPNISKEGLILSQQTNIALSACRGEYCQYIQGDEVIHENDIEVIKKSIDEMDQRPELEGLVFDYIHFYGNTDTYKYTRNVYRREVRLIRNKLGIISWKDAQGFKTKNHDKLKCIRTKAKIYHYGWARSEMVMAKKVDSFGKLYHGKDHSDTGFKYERIYGLKKFNLTHPLVMKSWIKENNNNIALTSMKTRFEWKNFGLWLSDLFEKFTGHRIGEYKNYKLT